MRVLCINNGFIRSNSAPEVTEGEVYTILTVDNNGICDFYQLVEVGANHWFLAERFIPLYGDETDVLEQEDLKEEVLEHQNGFYVEKEVTCS